MALTTTGLTIKSYDEIVNDIESDELANIDANLNVGPDDVLGQLNGIYAAALAELWELFEEIYQSAYPDTASGQSLSYIAALSGAIRQAATKAELDVRFYGTNLTDVPSGTRVYVDGDSDSLFQTTALVTVSGTSVDATVQAVTEGSATVAAATDTLVIATPVSGITTASVWGATPFLKGLDEETDSQLRDRREQTLAQAAASTVEAIRADMLGVAGVNTCTVFENTSGQTDVNGLPPNAIEVLVFSSSAPSYTSQDIVDQIWLSKPAGTETYGALSDTAVDSQGTAQTIYYSEPTAVRTYVDIDLTQTADGTYVGDADVAQAVEDWAEKTLEVGQNVYAADIIGVVASITGVETVNPLTCRVDSIATPATVDLVLTARQLGTVAAADVTVTS